jgi:hypothetical protein
MGGATRAQEDAKQFALDADVERLYALFLRTCDLPRRPMTAVTFADRYPSQRFTQQIETMPGGMPEGWAHFNASTVDTYLILGLEPPGLYISLTQAPKPLTAQQRLEAGRLAQRALDLGGRRHR